MAMLKPSQPVRYFHSSGASGGDDDDEDRGRRHRRYEKGKLPQSAAFVPLDRQRSDSDRMKSDRTPRSGESTRVNREYEAFLAKRPAQIPNVMVPDRIAINDQFNRPLNVVPANKREGIRVTTYDVNRNIYTDENGETSQMLHQANQQAIAMSVLNRRRRLYYVIHLVHPDLLMYCPTYVNSIPWLIELTLGFATQESSYANLPEYIIDHAPTLMQTNEFSLADWAQAIGYQPSDAHFGLVWMEINTYIQMFLPDVNFGTWESAEDFGLWCVNVLYHIINRINRFSAGLSINCYWTTSNMVLSRERREVQKSEANMLRNGNSPDQIIQMRNQMRSRRFKNPSDESLLQGALILELADPTSTSARQTRLVIFANNQQYGAAQLFNLMQNTRASAYIDMKGDRLVMAPPNEDLLNMLRIFLRAPTAILATDLIRQGMYTFFGQPDIAFADRIPNLGIDSVRVERPFPPSRQNLFVEPVPIVLKIGNAPIHDSNYSITDIEYLLKNHGSTFYQPLPDVVPNRPSAYPSRTESERSNSRHRMGDSTSSNVSAPASSSVMISDRAELDITEPMGLPEPESMILTKTISNPQPFTAKDDNFQINVKFEEESPPKKPHKMVTPQTGKKDKNKQESGKRIMKPPVTTFTPTPGADNTTSSMAHMVRVVSTAPVQPSIAISATVSNASETISASDLLANLVTMTGELLQAKAANENANITVPRMSLSSGAAVLAKQKQIMKDFYEAEEKAIPCYPPRVRQDQKIYEDTHEEEVDMDTNKVEPYRYSKEETAAFRIPHPDGTLQKFPIFDKVEPLLNLYLPKASEVKAMLNEKYTLHEDGHVHYGPFLHNSFNDLSMFANLSNGIRIAIPFSAKLDPAIVANPPEKVAMGADSRRNYYTNKHRVLKTTFFSVAHGFCLKHISYLWQRFYQKAISYDLQRNPPSSIEWDMVVELI